MGGKLIHRSESVARATASFGKTEEPLGSSSEDARSKRLSPQSHPSTKEGSCDGFACC
jgi:hypothetical protein